MSKLWLVERTHLLDPMLEEASLVHGCKDSVRLRGACVLPICVGGVHVWLSSKNRVGRGDAIDHARPSPFTRGISADVIDAPFTFVA